MRWVTGGRGAYSTVKNHTFFTVKAYSLRVMTFFSPQILPLFL